MIAHNVWSQAGGKTGWQLAAGSASRTVARHSAAAAPSIPHPKYKKIQKSEE
jgi:hypothetical protein